MDGFINVLKAPGMTSSNVVYDVRKIYHEKHAGHLGTLDPGAAGVLPVSLGRASKLFDLFVDKQKIYVFEITFGVSTDTLDAYGSVTGQQECLISRDRIEEALPAFLGKTMQRAPAYSALKVDGRKMYDLARAGEKVPDRFREIDVEAFSVLEEIGRNRFLFRLVCSRGTYVRVIAEDLGQSLGVPAYVSLLLREASGPFTTENAYSITELYGLEEKEAGGADQCVISCESALAFLPELILPAARRNATMNALPTGGRKEADGLYRVYSDGFLGVGRVLNGSLRLEIHLY